MATVNQVNGSTKRLVLKTWAKEKHIAMYFEQSLRTQRSATSGKRTRRNGRVRDTLAREFDSPSTIDWVDTFPSREIEKHHWKAWPRLRLKEKRLLHWKESIYFFILTCRAFGFVSNHPPSFLWHLLGTWYANGFIESSPGDSGKSMITVLACSPSAVIRLVAFDTVLGTTWRKIGQNFKQNHCCYK